MLNHIRIVEVVIATTYDYQTEELNQRYNTSSQKVLLRNESQAKEWERLNRKFNVQTVQKKNMHKTDVQSS